MKKISKIFILFFIFILVLNCITPFVNASNDNTSIESIYNNLPESQLGLANILNILLIVVGVLLILLGIAILIRLKN